MERELIGERTRVALAHKRANGQPTSHPPLGFRSKGRRHHMVPVPEELAVVRRILALWRTGSSYRAIAARLNEDGAPTKRGGRWHAYTVKKVVDRRAWYANALKAS
jgi:site-specific DNA recombinase